MGNRLIREEISGIPSDKSIKKSVQTLDEQEGDGIGLKDCVKAFACAEIVEFSREDEDLGICSYNRLANQVRKTLEGWEAQNEICYRCGIHGGRGTGGGPERGGLTDRLTDCPGRNWRGHRGC